MSPQQGFGEGFFYTPEDQEAQQQLRQKQAFAQALLKGQKRQGRYAGLANAGEKIAGALLSNKAEKQEAELAAKSQAEYTKSMAELLRGGSAAQGGGSGMLSNMAASPQDGMEMDPEGNPMQTQQPPQAQPQSFGQRLAASNNPALMYQFGDDVIKQEMGRDQKLWENDLPMARGTREGAELQGNIARGNAEFTNQLPMTAAQIAADRRQAAQLGETGRHNRETEKLGAMTGEFGKGMTGRHQRPGRSLYPGISHGLANSVQPQD